MLKIKRDPKLSITDNDQSLYVSLERIKMTATIRSLIADVIITQVFRNTEQIPIETIYYFPIENQDIAYTFMIRTDDQEIVIHSKDNNKTIDQGCGTNSFAIHVGAILPSKECTITIAYVTKLNFICESTIQFIIPTIINSTDVQLNPYTVEFDCTIEDMNELKHQQCITQVSSTSHPIQIHLTKQHKYVISFIQQNIYLNSNILINIELADTIVTSKLNNLTIASNSIEEDDHQTINTRHTSSFNYDNSLTNIITTNTVGQPFDYYCVLDFEAVCHQSDPSLKRPSPNDIWEIIEFPICLLEAKTNTIIDIYHSYVRPTIKTSLNKICINITGITQDIVDNSPTFDIVWQDVQKFLAKHSLISFEKTNSILHSFTWITCGNWDLRTMLPLQLKQCGLNRPKFINNFINLKELYMEYYPFSRIRGMKDMLKKSNLLLEGRHHSGIDDTKNIAKIAQWLIQNKKILKLTWKEI